MKYSILGPLEVLDDGGRALDIGGRKQRAVLAVLVLNANRVVPLERLIDDLWGHEAPARATGTLQAYVSNLRRVLEPDRPPRAPATPRRRQRRRGLSADRPDHAKRTLPSRSSSRRLRSIPPP